METRMHLLLVLLLLIFTDHCQGVPETYEQSLIVSTFTDSTVVGERLTTAHPINTPRWRKRLCNCKGKGGEMVSTHCRCPQSARRNGKYGKLKKLCRLEKNKNLKKCIWFSKLKTNNNSNKFGPSMPI